ncbi:hypothetical protein [Flavobacterium sp.]|jgi:hypothetical protein|uniref:hypothetical protein n=1 Tax=Flavobacterium sp. TaxID=239 RepID=UPI0037BE5A79
MRAKIFYFLILFNIIIGCSKSETEIAVPINTNGNYIGTFERNGISSNVQLNLNNGTFNGQSTVEKYPALCNGTYLIVNNTITFEDQCVWTAEFDWTLILNGEWNYNMNGNILTMIKSNGDKYTLTQQ